MSADPAEALARKMAMTAWSLVDGTGERLLPYARALLQAEKALAEMLTSPAEFEDGRMHYAVRQVERADWDDAHAALAALRAVIEP